MNIKKYAYNDKTQLTKNINVSELKCLGKGHTHNSLIDIDHVNKVQAFMNWAGYDRVDFSCFYRCKEYEKSKGRKGTSQHCISCASDQKFSKNGKVVSAKEVCCKAQDYGFKGIGYINKYYVHLDSRAKGSYRGDETVDYTNNVGGDFYKYFGIEKPNTKKSYSGTYPKLPSRGYFKKGDKGTQVKNLQKFLNWALNLKLDVDGIIGNKTINAIKQFQKLVKLKQDGLFGKDSLAKAKTYKK